MAYLFQGSTTNISDDFQLHVEDTINSESYKGAKHP